MKKILAALLTVMLVMTASVTAFGATKSDVDKKIQTAAAYALDECYGKDGYTVENSKYYLMYLKAGGSSEEYEKGFLDSVRQKLGDGTFSGIGTIGRTIKVLNILGADPKNFEGYDLAAALEETDPADNEGTPYSYLDGVEAAKILGLDECGKKLCAQMLTYYKMGEGTDFWGGYGTSPDDLAVFVLTLAAYADDYGEYIADAVSLIETYNSDGGYTSYGEANADSTAFVLAAYSALNDKERADAAYDKLMLFFNGETGGFTGSWDDYYATSDALFGLEYYAEIADADEPAQPDKKPETKPETKPDNETPAQQATQKPAAKPADKNENKSPDTGSAGGAALIAAAAATACALCAFARKKDGE